MNFYQYHDYCAESLNLVSDGSSIELPNFPQAFNMISANDSFIDFKLDISVEEQLIFEQLSVNSASSYQLSLQSHNITGFQSEYLDYLKSIGNGDKLSAYASSVLARLVDGFMSETNNNHFLVFGTSAVPTDLDNIFWHIDNYRDGRGEPEDYRYLELRILITLKGPSTWICDLEAGAEKRQEEIAILNQHYKALKKALEKVNETNMADVLASLPKYGVPCSAEKGHKIHQANTLVGTLFVTGKTENSAVHTSPLVTGERIFISFSCEKPY
jgi:hypothetical protein